MASVTLNGKMVVATGASRGDNDETVSAHAQHGAKVPSVLSVLSALSDPLIVLLICVGFRCLDLGPGRPLQGAAPGRFSYPVMRIS